MPSPDQYLDELETTPRHRPRKSIERRIGSWAAMLLSGLLLTLIVYGGYIAFNVAKLSTNPLSFSRLATDDSGRVNVLVLGEGDPGHSGAGLTDTVMVLSIDTVHNRVAQISIPRDMRVSIPGYGSGKINAANAVGGVSLAEQVVANTLDIPIHYYVKTNFSGLKGLVDAVGGIDVDVKERLYDSEYPCSDNQYKVCGLDIRPGLTHMDGEQALQYARCRKGTCGDDYGRAARQQEVLNLIRAKMVKLEVVLNPAKLAPITAAFREGVETDMGTVQMAQFGWLWQESGRQGDPVKLVLSTAADGMLADDPASSDLIPGRGGLKAIQQRVRDIFSQ